MKNWLKAICLLISYILVYIIAIEHNNTNKSSWAEKTDTLYNTIYLDSITYKITIRDSIIYHLKIETNEAIEQSYSINDSDAVELFKQLTSK